MNTKNIFIGRVYYYISSWLKGNNQEPHYIPIVSEPVSSDVLIVIITSYSVEKENSYKKAGDDSYVILEKECYPELGKKSITNCRPYREPLVVFRFAKRKTDLPKELLEKIIIGIMAHKNKKGWIEEFLKNASTS